MEIATHPLPSATSHSKGHHPVQVSDKPNSLNSMSQDYQQGILSFSNGFERSHQQQHQQHIAQQIRKDKQTVHGFEPPPPLVAMEEEESSSLPGYETAGMLSELFNFPSGTTMATELLESQIQANYRTSQPRPTGEASNQWFGDRQGMTVRGSKDHNIVNDRDSVTTHQHQISRINGDSAAAMQLFLMNPQPKSPSPSPSHLPSASSTLHSLLPNPSSASTLQGFHTTVDTASPGGAFCPSQQFTWFPDSSHEGGLSTAAQLNNPSQIGGIVEGQGLSLSLSSSLQHFEAAKAEELRMEEGGFLIFNQGEGPTSVQHQFKNLLQGDLNQNHQVHAGFGTSVGMVNDLRNSKYAKVAQELLEEFCSVGRGQFNKNKPERNNTNPNSNPSGSAGGVDAGGSSSSWKDPPSLSATDRLEHQRRKVKLLSMLDEVERRYNHYCEQMQMVVNSFDLVMGFGTAVPYTALAQKAMSCHFRCLKDAITAQLRHSCDLLGEKDASLSGVTKGETPRLKLLEQCLRQQKAFHQMGLMEQEAWRPQRGLPERSVNILRAWLFEHFLHPYPSDADKHLLARQTGLSRSQVSNWFINARVRLWKPMIEEMYEQETKEEAGGERERNQNSDLTQAPAGKRESDPSSSAINRQCLSENKAKQANSPSIMPTTSPTATAVGVMASAAQSLPASNTCHRDSIVGSDFGTTAATSGNAEIGSRLIQFGTIAGDVSLTLGLRHAGNVPDNGPFSVRDFENC